MNGQSRLLVEGGGWILDTIKRNPEGLLLVAAGAVLLMRTKSSASSTDVQNIRRSGAERSERIENATRETANTAASYASAAADAAGEAMDRARSYAGSATDAARETARSYASTASEYAGQARRAVGETSDQVVKQTRSMTQGILQNQPLTIAAVGLVAGAALAALFPPTQLERETLGPMGDQMSKAAERVGDQLKQATTKAGEKLKSSAEERGLDSEGLKQMASEIADTFRSSMAEHPEGTNENDFSGSGPSGSRRGAP